MSPPPRFPSGPHIVVADETPELLDFMVATLRSAHCCVYQAHDALAAETARRVKAEFIHGTLASTGSEDVGLG